MAKGIPYADTRSAHLNNQLRRINCGIRVTGEIKMKSVYCMDKLGYKILSLKCMNQRWECI